MLHPYVVFGMSLALLSFAPAAHAQFATPPPTDTWASVPSDSHEPAPGSLTRVHLGPAVDLADADPGLFAAIDVGRDAGVRISGTFAGVGGDGGSSVLGAELWLAPAHLGRLRPIVAAGAGFRDVTRNDGGALHHDRAGVALLRGGIELLLPTAQIDSRAQLSVVGHFPAIVESSDLDPRSSVVLVGSLALGF
jgi:hypothetical protein